MRLWPAEAPVQPAVPRMDRRNHSQGPGSRQHRCEGSSNSVFAARAEIESANDPAAEGATGPGAECAKDPGAEGANGPENAGANDSGAEGANDPAAEGAKDPGADNAGTNGGTKDGTNAGTKEGTVDTATKDGTNAGTRSSSGAEGDTATEDSPYQSCENAARAASQEERYWQR